MKLLFDENLSPKLPKLVATLFPGSSHVRDHDLKGRSDEEVWAFARDNGCILVSKDSDFFQRSMLYGYPPKVVWIRVGNCTTLLIVQLLTQHAAAIESMESTPNESVLVIH